MKILRIDLHAFGPFTGGRLDFARKPDALQVIYGPNEAGKSTTLRALIALLYGIPVRTSDAHLHDMARLRIGALLADHQGRIVSVTRRKGAKHTLLDAQGQPLPDSALTELLLGIDESMFRNMFGLDHQRLREGAEALLAGGGNLGEGLFDASVGTRVLRDVKEALRLEAEALYKARGKTPKLNLALDALREKSKQKKDAALAPSAYTEQTKGLTDAKKRRERFLAERRAALTEKSQLERDLRLLPLLARHAQLAAELGSLRDAVLGAKDKAASKELAEELIRDLERRYGAFLAFEAERPQVTAQLSTLERDMLAIRARLGAAANVERPIDTPLRTRLRRLAEEHSARARRIEELTQGRVQLEAERAVLEERLLSAPEEDAVATWSALVEGIEREDLGAARTRCESELSRKAAAVQRGLSQLGLGWAKQAEPDAVGCCERLASVPIPSEQELSQLEQAEQDVAQARSRAHEQQRENEARRQALARQKTELLAEGELSSREELTAARMERDAALLALETQPSAANGSRLRTELLRTDFLSDKLLHEAARSTEMARLAPELLRVNEEHADLERSLRDLAQRAQALEAQVVSLLDGSALPRESLRSLRTKALKLGALRDLAHEALEQRGLLHALDRRRAELAQSLRAQLGAAADAREAGLDVLLAEARARLATAAGRAQELKAWQTKRFDLDARWRGLEGQLTALRAEQSAALSSLSEELRSAGFQAALSHDEVLACLDDVALLHDVSRRHAALNERKQQGEEQGETLRRDVQTAVARLVPDAAAGELAEQLVALSRSERAQRELLRDEARLKQELDKLEHELLTLGDGATLAELRRLVKTLEPSAMRARLLEIEAQSVELEEQVGALDQEIGRLEGGLTHVMEAPHAVPIAEEVEAELANVRALLRRYLEVRLSLSLLAREVERHRLLHQGPLVTRASALFAALTLQRYSGLAVELDERDEPLLCAVQASGKVVRVAGLSDGTRDQLYLSLRIATIERFLEVSPALPLVLDDAFIHFDDARAEAALVALGELGKKTQVLFFTHHARMVDLAKRALKPSQVALHELDPVKGTVAFRDNGPLFAGA